MFSSAILPFKFSEAKLLVDLKSCEVFEFSQHFNRDDFSGDWKCISLRSKDGDPSNIKAFSPNGEFMDTPLLLECPYFEEIVTSLKCDKESIRLLNLTAGSKIHEHTDHNLGYEDGVFRLHIPITTNKDVVFYIDNQLVVMEVGDCWYGDFNAPHLVENNGKIDRVHLVIDCIRNEWSDAIFEKLGYDFSKENTPIQYSEETKQMIIENLKLLKTPTSEQLIQDLLNS